MVQHTALSEMEGAGGGVVDVVVVGAGVVDVEEVVGSGVLEMVDVSR
jgi:hypothetical protein